MHALLVCYLGRVSVFIPAKSEQTEELKPNTGTKPESMSEVIRKEGRMQKAKDYFLRIKPAPAQHDPTQIAHSQEVQAS